MATSKTGGTQSTRRWTQRRWRWPDVDARGSCHVTQGWGNPGLEDESPLGFGESGSVRRLVSGNVTGDRCAHVISSHCATRIASRNSRPAVLRL
jgi:hypothetical protein